MLAMNSSLTPVCNAVSLSHLLTKVLNGNPIPFSLSCNVNGGFNRCRDIVLLMGYHI